MRKTIYVCVTKQRKALKFHDLILITAVLCCCGYAVLRIAERCKSFLLIKRVVTMGKVVMSIVNRKYRLICLYFINSIILAS